MVVFKRDIIENRSLHWHYVLWGHVEEIFTAAQMELTTTRSIRDARCHMNTGSGRSKKTGMSFIGAVKEKLPGSQCW